MYVVICNIQIATTTKTPTTTIKYNKFILHIIYVEQEMYSQLDTLI